MAARRCLVRRERCRRHSQEVRRCSAKAHTSVRIRVASPDVLLLPSRLLLCRFCRLLRRGLLRRRLLRHAFFRGLFFRRGGSLLALLARRRLLLCFGNLARDSLAT